MKRIRPAPEIELIDDDDNVYPLSFPDRMMQSISGLGMPPLTHWTTRSPFQAGESHWGYAVRPRVINATLYIRGCNRANMYAKRRAAVEMMNPMNGPHRIRLVTPPPDPRQYELRNVWVTGGYELSSTEQPTPRVQIGSVQLTAYDPIWKWTNNPLDAGESRDADGRTCVEDDTFTLTAALVLPFVGPYLLGTTTATNTITCTNDGSWASKPVIYMEGPVNDWILSNPANGYFLSWDGYAIDTGETVTIDIQEKTVTSDVSGDVSVYLSGDTGSFALDPGVNALDFYASGGVVNLTTTITVCWFVEALGV